LRPLRAGVVAVGVDRQTERRPTLQSSNSVDLPSTKHTAHNTIAVPEERNLINVGPDKSVPDVERSIAVIQPPVIWIHRRAAIVRIAGNIQRMRPCVTHVELESVRVTLVHRYCQVMVIRDQIVRNRADLTE